MDGMTDLSQTQIVELTRTRSKSGVHYKGKLLNGYFFGVSGPIEIEDIVRQRMYERCGWSQNGA
jgi:hypothetical protein